MKYNQIYDENNKSNVDIVHDTRAHEFSFRESQEKSGDNFFDD